MASAPPNIFKATYSSVPVYEMPCKGVAVMKRRADGWLNATQILKVAGFDKPQRTRVLEREVQKGTHEKVQGGYGKYQGTWIPVERGVQLAQQYGVVDVLQPIINYVGAGPSPPPAPKHITAAPKGPRQKKGTPAAVASQQAAAAAYAQAQAAGTSPGPSGTSHPQMQGHMPPPPAPAVVHRPTRAARNADPVYTAAKNEAYEEGENSPGPSEGTSASRTPSPLGSEAPSEYSEVQQHSMYGPPSSRRKRKHEALGEDYAANARVSQGGPAVYARMILDYFVSESATIPAFLISPPGDFDPNVVIDDDGHTALHWACAMGRIRIVKLLLTAGADIFRANAMGQTALMRSVMFTNNYDLRKFPELFELLHRSTINIDRNDRTVFHYVIDIALQKGKAQAAKYYLEVILERLKEYPREVCDILNFQDEEGETALTLAARARSKNLVRILLHHGADAKIPNRDGKSAEDYILEDERARHGDSAAGLGPGPSPLHQSQLAQGGSSPTDPTGQPGALMMHDGMSQGMQMQPSSSGLQQQQAMPPQIQQQEMAYHQQQQPGLVQANGYYAPPPGQPLHGMHQYQQIPMLHPSMPHHLHYSEAGQRISGQVIPQMHEQLESLASAYDTELEDKEKDIAHAHAMLANIQAEVVESQRVSASLKNQADSLEEYQAKEAALQDELKDRMGKRFRLGWEKYVRDEEERQKPYVNIIKNEQDGYGSHTVNFNRVNGSANGGQHDIPADIYNIFSAPNGSETLATATQSARDQLGQLRDTRKELFDSYVNLQAEAGTGDKMNEYRKVIALGCGLQPQDVDEQLVRNLLDSLDNGEDLQLHPMAGPPQVEATPVQSA